MKAYMTSSSRRRCRLSATDFFLKVQNPKQKNKGIHQSSKKREHITQQATSKHISQPPTTTSRKTTTTTTTNKQKAFPKSLRQLINSTNKQKQNNLSTTRQHFVVVYFPFLSFLLQFPTLPKHSTIMFIARSFNSSSRRLMMGSPRRYFQSTTMKSKSATTTTTASATSQPQPPLPKLLLQIPTLIQFLSLLLYWQH